MYDYKQIVDLLNKFTQYEDDIDTIFAPAKQYGNASTAEKVALIQQQLNMHLGHHYPRPMFVETDLDGIITSVSDAFAEAARYTPDEMIGENINILKASDVPLGIYQQIWESITKGKPWRGEIKNRAKDYETYHIDTFIAPVFDPDGKPIRYWSVAFDISEKVRHEERLEHINKDTIESLKYAKRIQKTILPDKSILDEVWEENFLMFKPRDIVSGDFYWFAKTIKHAYIAVVDCTGHGVPGAFMSLIGYNLLNQIVLSMKIEQPGLILNELHKLVRATLRQDSSDSKSKDGMDVALCSFELYGDEVQYAGAFRPLFWWHNNELQEVKGDKMSIGGEQMEEERMFTTHLLEAQPGDILYMFSDGVTDQFGGPDQKKFSTKQLKQFIVDHHELDMNLQRAQFNLIWGREWKGDLEQTDDATLIGIRIKE